MVLNMTNSHFKSIALAAELKRDWKGNGGQKESKEKVVMSLQ